MRRLNKHIILTLIVALILSSCSLPTLSGEESETTVVTQSGAEKADPNLLLEAEEMAFRVFASTVGAQTSDDTGCWFHYGTQQTSAAGWQVQCGPVTQDGQTHFYGRSTDLEANEPISNTNFVKIETPESRIPPTPQPTSIVPPEPTATPEPEPEPTATPEPEPTATPEPEPTATEVPVLPERKDTPIPAGATVVEPGTSKQYSGLAPWETPDGNNTAFVQTLTKDWTFRSEATFTLGSIANTNWVGDRNDALAAPEGERLHLVNFDYETEWGTQIDSVVLDLDGKREGVEIKALEDPYLFSIPEEVEKARIEIIVGHSVVAFDLRTGQTTLPTHPVVARANRFYKLIDHHSYAIETPALRYGDPVDVSWKVALRIETAALSAMNMKTGLLHDPETATLLVTVTFDAGSNYNAYAKYNMVFDIQDKIWITDSEGNTIKSVDFHWEKDTGKVAFEVPSDLKTVTLNVDPVVRIDSEPNTTTPETPGDRSLGELITHEINFG